MQRLVTFFALASGLACSRAATLRVVHPSPLARYGREISVSPFTNEGDSDLSGLVSRGLAASPVFQVVQSGQRMQVVGRVVDRGVSPERLTSHTIQCTRQIAVTSVRNVPTVVDGRTVMLPQTVTEYVPRNYPCTELVRSVGARVRLQVTVNALTRPIRQVHAQSCDGEETATTTGLQGSDSEDHPPADIDASAVLREADERAVGCFLDAVLPRHEEVEVLFPSCEDSRCDQGLSRVRAGDLDGALAAFDGAANALGATPPTDPRARHNLAVALYARGIVRGYNGQIDAGLADLQRARTFDAAVPTLDEHLARLTALRDEQRRARFRGETRRLGRGR